MEAKNNVCATWQPSAGLLILTEAVVTFKHGRLPIYKEVYRDLNDGRACAQKRGLFKQLRAANNNIHLEFWHQNVGSQWREHTTRTSSTKRQQPCKLQMQNQGNANNNLKGRVGGFGTVVGED